MICRCIPGSKTKRNCCGAVYFAVTFYFAHKEYLEASKFGTRYVLVSQMSGVTAKMHGVVSYIKVAFVNRRQGLLRNYRGPGKLLTAKVTPRRFSRNVVIRQHL